MYDHYFIHTNTTGGRGPPHPTHSALCASTRVRTTILLPATPLTRNSNNISGYVYNREFITHHAPIYSHSSSKFESDFFSQIHVSVGIIKIV